MDRAAAHERWWHTAYLLCAWCGDEKKNQTPRDFHPYKDELSRQDPGNEYLENLAFVPPDQHGKIIEELMRRGKL